jgi:hypothetical protein
MRRTLRASMTLLFFASATSVGAQFLQYTPPGGPEQPPEARQQQLEHEVEEARYHLGPVRIAPWFTLRDVAYVRNFVPASETPDDFTATAGLGLRTYLRNGRKATWTLQVLPEYVWWARQSERRRLNGRYLLGYYGYFNRLTVEARAGREQLQHLASPELPVPVSGRSDQGELLAEVELSHAFYVFTAFERRRETNLVDELADPQLAALSQLDRDERIERAGLRWRPRRRWSIGLGAERSQVDFDHAVPDRSNSGTSPLAELDYEGRRARFLVNVADRSLTASRGSAFVPYNKLTGNAAAFLGAGSKLAWTLYASRNLVYSQTSTYAYLTDDRLGLSATVGLGLGGRLQTRLFVETGADDYIAFDPSAPVRQDDVLSYGATLTFPLARNVSVSLQGLHSRFDANLPGGDRTYSSLGTTINLLGGR